MFSLVIPQCVGRGLIKSYEVENTVYQLCVRADSLMASGKWAEARVVLGQAAVYDPTSYSANVHLNLGKCYSAQKKVDQAAAEMKKALVFDPSRPDALYNIGSMYYDNKKYDQAVAYLTRYMNATNDAQSKAHAQKFIREIGAYSNLDKAQDAIEAENYPRAKKLLDKAASYDPSPYSSSVHSSLCFVLQHLGQPEQAIAEGQQALRLEPDDRQTMYSIGLACADACKFDEAIAWINRCTSLESDAARRQDYIQCSRGFAEDKKQYNDPGNKEPDYLKTTTEADGPSKWPRSKLPLKVAILPGAGVKGYRDSYPNLVKQSFDAWCKASGDKLDYKIINDPKTADIKIVWTTNALKANSMHPNTTPVGLTHIDYAESGIIEHATIEVRTVDPYHPEEDEKEGECAHTILHEVGHALGLIGHSKLIRDIMYFRSARQQNGMTARDKATLARLYSSYPALSFAPKAVPTNTPTVYLPPPAFVPPEAPDNSKLAPPMFLPPPLPDEDEKLAPPMFTPPPIKDADAKNTKSPPPPMFTPPALKSGPTKSAPRTTKSNPSKSAPGAKKSDPAKSKSDLVAPPFFSPPPVK